MKATATNVSRTLGKTFARSTSHTSKVRGLPTNTTGFKVEKAGAETSIVRHINNGYAFSASAAGQEKAASALQAYAEALNAAGFDAEVLKAQFGYGNCVAVKTKH